MHLSEHPLISASAIQRRVDELGAEIAAHYGDEPITLIVVLKGGLPFAADLLRAIPVSDVCVEYIRARSYAGTASTGEVLITMQPEESLEGRHAIVVEDILDTGRTASAIQARILALGPLSCAVCALLDKPARREVPIEADFTGFVIENYFVVGYGLDLDERFRGLPAVFVLEEAEEPEPAFLMDDEEPPAAPESEAPFPWPEEEVAGEETPGAISPADPGSGQTGGTPSPGTASGPPPPHRARARRRRRPRPPFR